MTVTLAQPQEWTTTCTTTSTRRASGPWTKEEEEREKVGESIVENTFDSVKNSARRKPFPMFALTRSTEMGLHCIKLFALFGNFYLFIIKTIYLPLQSSLKCPSCFNYQDQLAFSVQALSARPTWTTVWSSPPPALAGTTPAPGRR